MEKKAFPDWIIKYIVLPVGCIVFDLTGIYKSIGRLDGGYVGSSIFDVLLYLIMAALALAACGGLLFIPSVYFSRKASDKGYDHLWRIPLAAFLIIVPLFAIIHGMIDNAADAYMIPGNERRHIMTEPLVIFLTVIEKPIGIYFLMLPVLIADDILTRRHLRKNGHDTNKAVRYLTLIAAAVCGVLICIVYSNIYQGIDNANALAAKQVRESGISYLDENYRDDFTAVLEYADAHEWTDWSTCPDESVEASWRRVFFSDTISADTDMYAGKITVRYRNERYFVSLSDDGLEIILGGREERYE